MEERSQLEFREMPQAVREPQAFAVGEASTEVSIWAQVWDRPWVGFALSATLPGVILSLLGPFGSFAAPFWIRSIYWMPTMALGAVFGMLITRWIERVGVLRERPMAQVSAIALAMAVVMSGVAWAMGRLVFGPYAIVFGPSFVFYVLLISVLTSAISAIIRARSSSRVAIAAAPAAPTSTQRPVPLAARLPMKLKDGEILALQGEDHYVRVHTDKGSDLILMRLADAVALMAHCPGARSHRSWWVAKAAVKGVRRENGRAWLQLANAIEAPVSRNYAADLRKAGWLN